MRQLKAQKKLSSGRLRKYTNLAVFNGECATRGNVGRKAMLCDLTNIRKLKDGSGLATIKVKPVLYNREGGTWLLHFASHSIMKQHLKGRVIESRAGMLAGSRSRKRKRSR